MSDWVHTSRSRCWFILFTAFDKDCTDVLCWMNVLSGRSAGASGAPPMLSWVLSSMVLWLHLIRSSWDHPRCTQHLKTKCYYRGGCYSLLEHNINHKVFEVRNFLRPAEINKCEMNIIITLYTLFNSINTDGKSFFLFKRDQYKRGRIKIWKLMIILIKIYFSKH